MGIEVLDLGRDPLKRDAVAVDNSASVTAFEQGNYTRAILQGSPEHWHWHAALGLIGRTDEALTGLARFRNPEARFYEGVAHWMAGDEIEAKRVLADVPSAHARQLLKLISKPVVRVLAMMPPGTSGPHLVYRGALTDPKFEIFNVPAIQDGSRNVDEECARIFQSASPDFFACQMLEWHQIPRGLRFFPCPTIGHTSDFDLHIHGVHGWLSAFDEILVCDHDEHDAAAKLTDAPISVFPKAFACPQSLPRPLRRERVFDVFLSGTLFHPWHPDKARLIHQLLGEDGLKFLGFNGYLPEDQYFESLARSRMCVAYYRRDGGMLTRAIESASMGCVTLVPQGSVVNLYTQPRGTLVEYSTSGDGLLSCVKSVLAQYEMYEQRAWKAAPDFRRELGAALVGSQYMRFCTFLAAKPRPRRPSTAPRKTDQRHLVMLKGWLPPGGLKGMRKLAAENIRLWRQSPTKSADERFAARNNILRERLLIYLRLVAWSRFPDWQTKPFEFDRSAFPRPGARARLLGDYRRACAEHPDRLVMIFNYLRAAIHVGSDLQLANALQFLTETLARSPDDWRVDPEDDVMSYDVFPLCFNYRRYIDTVCACFAGEQKSTQPLVRMILASLFHYRARLLGTTDDARTAYSLDPEFPYFALDYGKRLALSDSEDDRDEAGRVLAPLVGNSMVAGEALAILTRLGHDSEIEPLASRVRRIENGIVASEQYLWEPHNILSAAQIPHLKGALGPRLISSAKPKVRPSPFSVLFIDQAFRNWKHYAEMLSSQSTAGTEYESIIADAYDLAPEGVSDAFDKVILCGQYDFLAHCGAVANYAALTARSDILLIVEGTPEVGPDTFESLVDEIETGRAQAVVANYGRGCILACERKEFFGWMGFEENSIYAGSGSIVGALCERLAAAGLSVVSHTGPIPKSGLSSVRKDFLKIVQESKSAPQQRTWLLPSQPSQLVRARSLHRDVLRDVSIKSFVQRLPNGYYVPGPSPQSVAIVGLPMALAPGRYRLAWAVQADVSNPRDLPVLSVEVSVDREVAAAATLTARDLAEPGFLAFAAVRSSQARTQVCEFRLVNRSPRGWTLAGLWLQALEQPAAEVPSIAFNEAPAEEPSTMFQEVVLEAPPTTFEREVAEGPSAVVAWPPAVQIAAPYPLSFGRRIRGLWGALRYGLPPDFDPAAYLRHNPDVAMAGVDPVQHFRQFGYREGRQWAD